MSAKQLQSIVANFYQNSPPSPRASIATIETSRDCRDSHAQPRHLRTPILSPSAVHCHHPPSDHQVACLKSPTAPFRGPPPPPPLWAIMATAGVLHRQQPIQRNAEAGTEPRPTLPPLNSHPQSPRWPTATIPQPTSYPPVDLKRSTRAGRAGSASGVAASQAHTQSGGKRRPFRHHGHRRCFPSPTPQMSPTRNRHHSDVQRNAEAGRAEPNPATLPPPNSHPQSLCGPLPPSPTRPCDMPQVTHGALSGALHRHP